MAGEAHKHLVKMAEKWLKQNGFGVVATEIRAVGTREEADAIGFRSNCSVIVEAKASRRDFLADRRKPERITGVGLGLYRFYLSPPEVIAADDLPKGWGLIHLADDKLVDVVRPKGNRWPRAGVENDWGCGWSTFQHPVDQPAEQRVLFSIARRLTLKVAKQRAE